MGSARKLREYGLTAGTLGSTAAQTVMVALLPVMLSQYAPSAIWIGLVIGGEGVFALLVPYWIGHLSDHLPARWVQRLGRRTFFLFAMAPLMAVSLAITPFLDGYWTLAGAAFVFFAAFHGYLTPLWALMIDAVPEERRGRVHGVRGALHAGGLGFGLVAGGLLYALWAPLPFLIAALMVLAMTLATYVAAPSDADGVGREPSNPGGRASHPAEAEEVHDRVPPELIAPEGSGEGDHTVWREALRRPELRDFLLANALWTGAVDGIRPYVFPFALVVLGISVADTSLVLLLLLVGVAIGTVLIGRLGDRFGRARLLEAGALLTAIALLLGTLVRDVTGVLPLLLGAGLGAAALIALPYPLFARLTGERAIGRFTGVYVLTMGAARMVAPVLVGAAIDLGVPLFPDVEGFPLMWPIAALLAFAGAYMLHRVIRGSVRLG